MTTRPILYPALIAAYPVLYLYAHNASQVDSSELIAPVALAAVAGLLLWGGAWAALKDPHRAGLLATIGVVYFATVELATGRLEYVLWLLSGFWVRRAFNLWPPAVVAAQTALFAWLARAAIRKVREPRRWTPPLNAFAAALVALPTIAVVRDLRVEAAARRLSTPPLAVLAPTDRRPDIYYIILDGFARGDVLAETFDYDLEPFLRRLESRGFYVPRHSTSNYCQTPLSLASSLNGVYLEPKPDDDPTSPMPPDPSFFRDNAVFKSLRPLGYRFVTFASGFDFTEHNRSDLYLSPYPSATSFQRTLMEGNPLHHLLWNPGRTDSYTMTRERTLFLLDQLPRIATMDGPTFTFAHIVSPHPPFVFGEDGEDVSPRGRPYFLNDGDLYRNYYGDEPSYIRGYRAQVVFLVKRVERAIEAILAASPEPPIILLQSDHGSGLHLSLGSAEATDHRERMSILNAYYLPGGGREGLHDRITPVNSFRAVFNNEFGARLDSLPDESYYSTWDRPFHFTRVTDRVAPPAASSPVELDTPAAPRLKMCP